MESGARALASIGPGLNPDEACLANRGRVRESLAGR